MASIRTRIGAPVFMAVLLAISAGCGGSKHAAKSPTASDTASNTSNGPAEVGKPAPELAVQSVNGKGKISLESLQGKVVVVDFWATWCGPCKQSFPKLEELSKKTGGKVEVVGISVDDQVDGVADFAKTNGATFAIGWDQGHTVANRWKVDTMPTTYVLDGSGTVRFVHDGYHDGETDKMAKEVAQLVEEGPSKKGDTKVAKNDTKTDTKTESKSDAASSAASDSSSSSSSASNSSDDASEPPPAAPKHKKKGRGGGKKAGGKKRK
jgi:thiol-disulfide isomerase/thioredoxin